MSVLQNNPFLIASGSATDPTFPVQRSLRFRGSASAYFNRTPASAGNQQKFTWSGWVKLSSISTEMMLFDAGTGNAADFRMYIGSTGMPSVISFNGAVYTTRIETSALLRDPSAWYHIVFAIDTTQATASNRVLIYINGVLQTALSQTTYMSQNFSTYINSVTPHTIGRYSWVGSSPLDGYLTEVYFIDGQQLAATSFGGYNTGTGVWEPRKYTGTYGTNGFYLNFQDNSAVTAAAIGKDSSGNGNNWTPNNISLSAGITYDSMLDVPTLTSSNNANFCTLNPLKSQTAPTAGALQVSSPTVYGSRATMAVSSGKWYWEVTAITTTNFATIGVLPATIPITVDAGYTSSSCSAYYASNGLKILNGAYTSYGASWNSGDVIGVALDCDANTIQFYKNGTAQGSFTLYTSAGTEIQPFVCDENNAGSAYGLNFGQRPFVYTAPSGYKTLNTFNLPTPTVVNGATQFAATTYTGNGSTQNISNAVNGVSFQPDMVWVKARSVAYNNYLEDSVRGVGKDLSSNLTDAETTFNLLSSFNSNGFTAFTNGTYLASNQNGTTYVGWQWKGGGTAVTNTAGSVTSSVSANPSAGISIVGFTGMPTSAGTSTIGHGLGVAPNFLMIKNRDLADNWYGYHSSLGTSAYISLNLGNVPVTGASMWGPVSPTSTVFTLRNTSLNTTSAQKLIAYCFAEVAGFSKFGSYTGNGSTNGPFIYTGFRPRWIMIKKTDSSSDWWIWDTSRTKYNQMQSVLYANVSAAEFTGSIFEFDALSNGFKNRSSNVTVNGNGATYIYAAFAENPFKHSLAR